LKNGICAKHQKNGLLLKIRVESLIYNSLFGFNTLCC